MYLLYTYVKYSLPFFWFYSPCLSAGLGSMVSSSRFLWIVINQALGYILRLHVVTLKWRLQTQACNSRKTPLRIYQLERIQFQAIGFNPDRVILAPGDSRHFRRHLTRVRSYPFHFTCLEHEVCSVCKYLTHKLNIHSAILSLFLFFFSLLYLFLLFLKYT